jgi:hypothetical protein
VTCNEVGNSIYINASMDATEFKMYHGERCLSFILHSSVVSFTFLFFCFVVLLSWRCVIMRALCGIECNSGSLVQYVSSCDLSSDQGPVCSEQRCSWNCCVFIECSGAPTIQRFESNTVHLEHSSWSSLCRIVG